AFGLLLRLVDRLLGLHLAVGDGLLGLVLRLAGSVFGLVFGLADCVGVGGRISGAVEIRTERILTGVERPVQGLTRAKVATVATHLTCGVRDGAHRAAELCERCGRKSD